ncbi:entericidin EcnAB [Hylemonella sp. W303a]|uniref:entericidin EcnAB n=1 Tax=Hylemonella sp. W303a TaxID=3389873 RepID=UPI00396B063E
MKRITLCFGAVATCLVLAACSSTWSGVKEDSKEIGHSVGKGLEKAGEKIQEMTK